MFTMKEINGERKKIIALRDDVLLQLNSVQCKPELSNILREAVYRFYHPRLNELDAMFQVAEYHQAHLTHASSGLAQSADSEKSSASAPTAEA